MKIYDNIQCNQTSREKSSEGFLIIRDCKVARTGILTYRPESFADAPAGLDIIRINRGPIPLLEPDTLSTWEGKPFVVTHPGEVTPDNARQYVAGHFGNLRGLQNKWMIADITVFDAEAIRLIESGEMKELSLGYDAKVNWAPGMDAGQPYDGEFIGYTGNHLALVPAGRCGSECRVADENEQNQGNTMPKIKIKGVDYEAPEQTIQAFKLFMDEAEEAAEKKEDEDEEPSDKKKMDQLQAKCDELEAKLKDAMEKASSEKIGDAAIEAAAEQRAAVCTQARVFLGDSADFKGKSIIDIKRMAIEKRGFKMDGKNADYIEARFDAMLDTTPPAALTVKVGDAATTTETKSLSERKRAEQIEKNRKG